MSKTKKQRESKPHEPDTMPEETLVVLKDHSFFTELSAEIEAGSYQGPQASTLFREYVLERIDSKILSEMDLTADKAAKINDWMQLKKRSIHEIQDRLAEIECNASCVGSNDRGRLFSKEWFARLETYEIECGYELVLPIFNLWRQFATRVIISTTLSKDKKEIAKLKKDLAALEMKAKDLNIETA